jgi:hypothetical protein
VLFGPQELFVSSSKHVALVNQGKVAFDFSVAPSPLALPIVDVSPAQGRLKAGERVRLNVTFLSAIPDQVEEVLQLTVAHFDPVPLRISALGVFPQLFVDLPRADAWQAAQAAASEQADAAAVAAKQPMLIEEVDEKGNVVSSSPAWVLGDNDAEEKHSLTDGAESKQPFYSSILLP